MDSAGGKAPTSWPNLRFKIRILIKSLFLWPILGHWEGSRSTSALIRQNFNFSQCNQPYLLCQAGRFLKFYTLWSFFVQFIWFSILSFQLYVKPSELNKGSLMLKLHCFLPRITFHQSLEQRLLYGGAAVICILNVVWRLGLFVEAKRRAVRFDLLELILADERRIARLSEYPTPTQNSSSPVRVNSRKHSIRDSSHANSDNNEGHNRGEKITGDSTRLSSQTDEDENENLRLASLLFYKLENITNGHVQFRRRPNRTDLARARTAKLLSIIIDLVALVTLTSLVLLASTATYDTLFHLNEIYPQCELSRTDDWYWLWFGWRVSSSLFFTFHASFEAIVGWFLGTALAGVVMYDVLLYWRQVESTLADIVKTLFSSTKKLSDSNLMGDQEGQSSVLLTGVTNEPDLEQPIADLQALVADFFSQLREVDRIMGLINSIAVVAWLGHNLLLTWLGLQTRKSYSLIVVRFFQLLGLLTMGAISQFGFRINRRTRSAYVRIASAMALDQSPFKRRWANLLDNFTGQTALYGFSLFGNQMYTQIIFLRIILSTFSLIMVVEHLQTMSR